MSNSSNSHPEGQGYNSDASAPSGGALIHKGPNFSNTSLASIVNSPPQQAKPVRTNIDRCGSELSKRDLVSIRACYEIPQSVIMRRPRATQRANAPPSGPRSIFVVALEMACVSLSILSWETCCFWDGLPIDVRWVHAFRKSIVALPGSTKHKADFVAFTSYWANKHPMPLHLYSDPRVLKATDLAPGSVADLGALDSLRATYNVGDHAPLPLLIVPTTSSDQQPLRPRPSAGGPSVTSPSDDKGSVLPVGQVGTTTPADGPILVGEHSATVVLEPKGHKEVGSATPLDSTPSPLPTSVVQDTGSSPSAPEGPSASKKRMRSPPSNPLPIQSQRRSDKALFSRVRILSFILPSILQLPAPPAGGSSLLKKPSTDPSHEELISSLSTLGDKEVSLRSYKRLLASYKEASGSSSRVSQLEQEHRTLTKEKAQEEGSLQPRLKNLAGDNNTLKEKYASIKEREVLRTSRDEAFQSNDRLLGQLEESRTQATILETSLEGIQTPEGLRDLGRGSEAGRELLLRSFSLAIKRTV
ncbi:hypothetical protein LIER_15459 [Lithospermum erythrorhizon]|uniref:Uncharacterized protein n=1 Tax=Lithospermum erythrorhizon TaxID=34254 RepID=A0AAV3Q325_LITER